MAMLKLSVVQALAVSLATVDNLKFSFFSGFGFHSGYLTKTEE